MKDYIRSYGPAALGARLRRLSESIDEDAARIYADLEIEIEQRWVGVLEELAERGSQSVGELAAALGIRHSSVSQTRRSLEQAGLVSSDADPLDARSRKLRLSLAGARLVRRLQVVWGLLNAVSMELDAEAGNAIAALDRLDDALNRVSLYERVRQRKAFETRRTKRAP
jgi:MarR family transcriptional regulator, organic hydroperoxide resistance regulator